MRDQLAKILEKFGFEINGDFWSYRGPKDAGESSWGVPVLYKGQPYEVISQFTMTQVVRNRKHLFFSISGIDPNCIYCDVEKNKYGSQNDGFKW